MLNKYGLVSVCDWNNAGSAGAGIVKENALVTLRAQFAFALVCVDFERAW